jgi:proteic killer suppression protein
MYGTLACGACRKEHMIVSFGAGATEDLYHGRTNSRVRRLPQDVRDRAIQKLDVFDASASLLDLRVPPGNILEALGGDLQGFYSMRVTQQWRIIFQWDGHDAHEVSLVDYH